MPLVDFTQADILLTERRRLEQPLLLMIWLGTISFALAEDNWLYILSGTLAVAVNWIAVRQNKELFVDRKLVNMGVATSLAIAILEYVRLPHQMLVVTVGHFMILLQLCKLFEQKRTRDYAQLISLNILLVVITAIITTSLWLSLVILIYIFLAMYVAMVFTIKRGLDAAAQTQLMGESGPLSPRRIAWNVVRDWPSRPIRKMLVVILIPSLIGAVLAFLFVPRSAGKMANVVGQSMLSMGFDPSIRLQGKKEIYLSDRIIMQVRISQNEQPVKSLSDSQRYLRTRILDTYSNSVWKNSGVARFRLKPRNLPKLSPELKKTLLRYDIQVAPLSVVDLMAPYPTVGTSLRGDYQVKVSPDLEWAVTRGYHITESLNYSMYALPRPYSPEARQWLASFYALEKKTDSNLSKGLLSAAFRRIVSPEKPSLLRQEKQFSLILKMPPETRQRIIGLARQWAGDLLQQRVDRPEQTQQLNRQIAQKLATRMGQEYSYTLDLTDSDVARDGVEDFLFHMQHGHCEYFASALAVMCNLVQVPARVAGGFVFDEYNSSEQCYIVREQDAHAWCEVYSDLHGWEIIDPTPAGERSQRETSMFQPLKDWFENLRFWWYQNIVGYDSAQQKEMSKKVAKESFSLAMQLGQWWRSVKESLQKFFTKGLVDQVLIVFALLLLAVAGCVVGGVCLRRWRKRKNVKKAQLFEPIRLAELSRLMKQLEIKGFSPEPGATLHERIDLAIEQFGFPADTIRPLAELQYAWRWGQQEPTVEQHESARRQLDALLQCLQKQDEKPAGKTPEKK